jgi:hypothetical protein
MKLCFSILIVAILTVSGCKSEISKEKREIVELINQKVAQIDHNHRVSIIDEDHRVGDSLYKVRGYFVGDKMLKIIGILRTPHFERDDYFYFEDHEPIFSGHMINFMDERLAEEFKYYYDGSEITEALFWEDHYQEGARFPHEHFKEFKPNQDSLLQSERQRLLLFLTLLDKRGVEIKHLNENLN